ncbi:hypothetical protein EDC94DRAFT_583406 [Helicostylum pulchrum]|nr:hypothetical protein EDC94DRAFT_583406 [Helicostylum pulchrum]
MRTAYFAKNPKRKRGPGLKVNLEKLWSSSKLDEKEITKNESEQSSEVESSCMSDEEDETVGVIGYKLNDEDATEFEKVLLANTEAPHILKNGHDFSDSFKKFHLAEARSSGLFINSNIHELLSLYRIVLLRKDQHDQAMSNVIELNNIQELHTELLDKYVNQNIKMEKNLFIELTNIFRSVNKKSDRKLLKVKLRNLYEAADPFWIPR